MGSSVTGGAILIKRASATGWKPFFYALFAKNKNIFKKFTKKC